MLLTSRLVTAPPASTHAHINPTTFQHLKRRRPIRNLDSKTPPEEFCSRGEILLCDVTTFSEETFEFAKPFFCDFNGWCDIWFIKEGLSGEEEVCLVDQGIIDERGFRKKEEKGGKMRIKLTVHPSVQMSELRPILPPVRASGGWMFLGVSRVMAVVWWANDELLAMRSWNQWKRKGILPCAKLARRNSVYAISSSLDSHV